MQVITFFENWFCMKLPVISCVFSEDWGKKLQIVTRTGQIIFTFFSLSWQNCRFLKISFDCLLVNYVEGDLTPFSPLVTLTNLRWAATFRRNIKKMPSSEWDRITGWLVHIDHSLELQKHRGFHLKQASEFTEDLKSHVACQGVFIESPLGSHGLNVGKQNTIFIWCEQNIVRIRLDVCAEKDSLPIIQA